MKNKTPLFICLVIPILFFACEEKGEVIPPDFTDPCNYYIGDYQWLPGSVEKIPYSDKDAVVFVDSMGNEVKLNITYTEFLHNTRAMIKGNPDNETEKIYYCYYQDTRTYTLATSESPFKIHIQLEAIPYYNIPREGYIADEISVFIEEDTWLVQQSFSKIIDQRTFPALHQYIKYEPVLTCLGRTFTDVESNAFVISGSSLYYNDTYGVVCFIDKQGTQWRFDRFE